MIALCRIQAHLQMLMFFGVTVAVCVHVPCLPDSSNALQLNIADLVLISLQSFLASITMHVEDASRSVTARVLTALATHIHLALFPAELSIADRTK